MIDMVATDHAPHADWEKDHAWEEAPFGVIGLEWAGAVVNTVLGLPAEDFFRVMSSVPALFAGMKDQGKLEVGAAANLVVFDPGAVTNTTASLSRSSNAPYLGLDLQGAVIHTVYGGRFTVRDGASVETVGVGG